MVLSPEAKKKINFIFSTNEYFLDNIIENFKNKSDSLFVISAFENIFSDAKSKLLFSKDFTDVDYHEMIYTFDSVMSAWRDNLPYNMDFEDEHSNDLYAVLFSSLQAIKNIIEESSIEDPIEEDYIEKSY